MRENEGLQALSDSQAADLQILSQVMLSQPLHPEQPKADHYPAEYGYAQLAELSADTTAAYESGATGYGTEY
jgi:hypothetical protein